MSRLILVYYRFCFLPVGLADRVTVVSDLTEKYFIISLTISFDKK